MKAEGYGPSHPTGQESHPCLYHEKYNSLNDQVAGSRFVGMAGLSSWIPDFSEGEIFEVFDIGGGEFLDIVMQECKGDPRVKN